MAPQEEAHLAEVLDDDHEAQETMISIAAVEMIVWIAAIVWIKVILMMINHTHKCTWPTSQDHLAGKLLKNSSLEMARSRSEISS